MNTHKTPKSLLLSYVAVFSSLMAVLTVFIIPMPTPLGGYDSSSTLIFILAILLGPTLATTITCLGQFIGTFYLVSGGTMPLIFLPGIIAVRGPEAAIVGALRKRNELFAMVVGPIWETIGFLIADIWLFGPAGLIVAFTIVDLIWVAPAILGVAAIRRAFQTKYLDTMLNLDSPENKSTKQAFLYTTWFAILISWVFLFMAPFAGWI
ncbi:MAG: hypothetical protein ACXACA_02315 [Candidatus Ranarchaeia archaeon]|jgi:uncharacterized membrane protein